jgi:hypothetical protein
MLFTVSTLGLILAPALHYEWVYVAFILTFCVTFCQDVVRASRRVCQKGLRIPGSRTTLPRRVKSSQPMWCYSRISGALSLFMFR